MVRFNGFEQTITACLFVGVSVGGFGGWSPAEMTALLRVFECVYFSYCLFCGSWNFCFVRHDQSRVYLSIYSSHTIRCPRRHVPGCSRTWPAVTSSSKPKPCFDHNVMSLCGTVTTSAPAWSAIVHWVRSYCLLTISLSHMAALGISSLMTSIRSSCRHDDD